MTLRFICVAFFNPFLGNKSFYSLTCLTKNVKEPERNICQKNFVVFFHFSGLKRSKRRVSVKQAELPGLLHVGRSEKKAAEFASAGGQGFCRRLM